MKMIRMGGGGRHHNGRRVTTHHGIGMGERGAGGNWWGRTHAKQGSTEEDHLRNLDI